MNIISTMTCGWALLLCLHSRRQRHWRGTRRPPICCALSGPYNSTRCLCLVGSWATGPACQHIQAIAWRALVRLASRQACVCFRRAPRGWGSGGGGSAHHLARPAAHLLSSRCLSHPTAATPALVPLVPVAKARARASRADNHDLRATPSSSPEYFWCAVSNGLCPLFATCWCLCSTAGTWSFEGCSAVNVVVSIDTQYWKMEKSALPHACLVKSSRNDMHISVLQCGLCICTRVVCSFVFACAFMYLPDHPYFKVYWYVLIYIKKTASFRSKRCICICIHVYMYMYIFIYWIYIYLYKYIYLYMCVCRYMYVYICIHTYIRLDATHMFWINFIYENSMQYANLRHKAAHCSYIHNLTIEVNAQYGP